MRNLRQATSFGDSGQQAMVIAKSTLLSNGADLMTSILISDPWPRDNLQRGRELPYEREPDLL